jgi:tetratricopeptide (TPR) repeat protein
MTNGMHSDLFTYLSGWIPLGLWLIVFVGIVFTAFWMTVYFGTKFWDRRHFWKIYYRGWILILSLYLIGWIANPPPPIPIRVVISTSFTDADPSQVWQIKGFSELIKKRLLSSPKPFVVMTDNYCPVLVLEGKTEQEINDNAVHSRATWIVHFRPEKGAVSVDVKKRSGAYFNLKADFNTSGMPFTNSARDLIESIGKQLGDKRDNGEGFELDILQPDSVLTQFFNALVVRDSGELEASNAMLYTLNRDNPSWTFLRKELARTQLMYHPSLYKEQIVNALIDISRQTPGDAEVFRLLGWTYLEGRNWEKAESALKIANNLNSDEPRIYYLLSRLSDERLENLPWKSKRLLLDRALQLTPAYESAALSLAKFYVSVLDRRLALETLEKAQAVDPASVPILLSRSGAFVELRRNEEAIELCERILDLEPGHPSALYNMGIALVWQENYDEGIAALDSSYSNGGTVDNLYYMGVAYQRNGEWELAEKYFQQRFALPTGLEDRVAVSARERVKMLRGWIASRDSLETMDTTSQQ